MKKTVDIDTSGPGAEVELPNEKEQENVAVEQDSVESNDTPEKSSEQLDVQADKQEQSEESKETKEEVKQEQKKELDDYSEGVKRRIAKTN